MTEYTSAKFQMLFPSSSGQPWVLRQEKFSTFFEFQGEVLSQSLDFINVLYIFTSPSPQKMSARL